MKEQYQKQIWLLENLLKRVEENKNQATYRLPGNITPDEMGALNQAIHAFYFYAHKMGEREVEE